MNIILETLFQKKRYNVKRQGKVRQNDVSISRSSCQLYHNELFNDSDFEYDNMMTIDLR